MTVAPTGGRLAAAFSAHAADGRAGLIPYVMAGWPRPEDTVPLLLAAQRSGALAVELGLPFSDPLADGPTIQAAGARALDNGTTTESALAHVAAARAAGLTVPLALMTYVNLVLAYGAERFTAGLAAAGGDGLIVADLPAGESAALRRQADAAGVALIPLVAPTTTDERLREACDGASGFVYCVSVTGTTGARRDLSPQAVDLLARVRRVTGLPRALGFGISRPEHVAALRGRAEAAVVASALIDAVVRDGGDPATAAEAFLRGLAGGA